MKTLKQAAQDVIDCVDSPYIPDEIRMVDVKCIEALRKALQAEPLFPAPPSVDALIAEIEGLGLHDTYVNFKDIRTILDKYRSAK